MISFQNKPGRIVSLVFTFVVIALCQFSSAAAQRELPEGFEPIFNGTDLSGWYAMQTYDPRKFAANPEEDQQALIEEAKSKTGEFWRVEDGEIVNDGEGPFLTYEKPLRDYELVIEYKTVALADSGIYLKASPQVQIWDFTPEGGKEHLGATLGSGGLWNNSKGSPGRDPLELADNPFGDWNYFRIRQIGARTSVWLNEKLVVDNVVMENNHWDRSMPLVNEGRIQLQTHGGEIRWRNIGLRELDSEEANRILQEIAGEGFEPKFNGVDFAGWKGEVDNYEIEDGSLRCKPDKGGTIFTEEEFSDFEVAFEFKLPPGGNNGLAIRYPGSGDTAYVGMCELQVLDSEHEKFLGKIDPRQAHGSVYGMIPAHRGYLRETGQWNFQHVKVEGSTIVVELNGTIILNGDVSEVTEFLSAKGADGHPGRERTRGHFGFAGHGDPVEFRNVMIKPLEK